MKKQNIMEEYWDTLIILDACRYDFFEKVYKDYLSDGKLEKRRSKGSSTLDWLKNNFTGKYDITYISASPNVNSYGIPLSRLHNGCSYSWKATEHFSKIIDVWHFGWDENLGTVYPREVNMAYLSNKDDNRKIIHYSQPHAPYLSFDYCESGRNVRRNKILKKSGDKVRNDSRYKGVLYLRKLVASIAVKVIGIQNARRLREKLRMKPKSLFDAILRKEGIKGVRYYYEDNLRKVLESVSRLIDELEGKIVVTADHGEALGEAGIFGHRPETYIPVLVEVPWLVIEKPKKSKGKETKAEKERVKAKVKKLKDLSKL